jgi:hypothetical protein
MISRIVIVAFLFTSLFGCTDEKGIDCSLVLCAAGDSINLEIIADGENLISNGTYTSENILVSGNTAEEIKIQVYPDTRGGTTGLLEILSFDWKAGTYTYTVALGNDYEFDLEVTFGVTNYPCCGDRLEIRKLTSNDVFIEEYKTYASFYTIILN